MPQYLAETLTRLCGLPTPLTPADLGLAPRGHSPNTPFAPPPVAPDEAGDDQTKRRTALALIGGTALTPLMSTGHASAQTVRAYTQHATTTELSPGDIEQLDLAVHHLGATYSAQPPNELWPVAAAHRHQAFVFLHERRHTLDEGRALARHSGMLSVVLAWLAHDLGKGDLVDALCEDAWVHGKQAGAKEVGAWAEDARCTHKLYAGHPLDALTAATRGLAVAPKDGNAAVRLSAQVARANALLGNRGAYRAAAATSHRHQARLPLHAGGLYAVDAVRITSYDATSLRWLGDADRARTAAQQAIDYYRTAPQPHQAPTRLAIAQLDLAHAHVALRDPEAAVDTARQAITGTRLVNSVKARAQELDMTLRRRFPTHPAVGEFAEEVRALPA
ncbi:hypothetical protein CTZ27_29645 [Streptomyces griseocarneus]|nr:hypothetical protein CTZ27_29645 [Streptomyces griseocarneus]